jgi:hypothetical protein
MNSLISFWLKGECPILNGVMFSDGSVECVEPYDQPRPAGAISLVGKGRTQLQSHIPLESTGLMPLCRCEDKAKGIVVTAGEAGMGSDGFVAVADLSNQLQWIAFFDFSNPFISVEVSGDEVVSRNNLGETWRFPLAHPSAVRVEVP